MTERPFRFGVLGVPYGGAQQWLGTARRAEELGYTSLLMPDGLNLLAPGPSLASAAAVTGLRVGTWVYAAPLRTPRALAWEAHSLSVLTDGRFDCGVGTGRPDAAAEAEALGLPFGSPGRRLAQVREAVTELRALDGERRTPVLMAAGGPKARELAAELADVVTFAASPIATRDEVAAMTRDLRAKGGGDVELATSLFAAGNAPLPAGMEQIAGVDADTLRAHDSLTLLPGDTPAMVDELRRRRDQLGISYVIINAGAAEELAPAVEILTGS